MSASVDSKINPSVTSTTTGSALEQGASAVATAQILNQSTPSTIPTSESSITRFQLGHILVSFLGVVLTLATLVRVFSQSGALDTVALQLFLNSSWIPDLTTQGVEPNPGPSKHRIHAEELVLARSRLKPRIPKAPPMVSIRNAPPISRSLSAPRQKMKKMTNLAGSEFNPRADMIGYFQTLCDAEKHPPVRLGGETMIQTGLTTLHTVVAIGVGSTTSQSIVVHPRVWNPILVSTSSAAPYSYGPAGGGGFPASTVSTLQSLAAAARVVSMKVKVYTLASATNDSGALTVGLCPTDPSFSNLNQSGVVVPAVFGVAQVSGTVAFGSINAYSQAGYPITGLGTIGTQGFNEFPAEDWSDTMPLKDGAAIFWLPEDPSSLVFRGDRIRQTLEASPVATGTAQALQVGTVNMSEIQDPFVCIGLTGLTANSTVNVEIFLNLEYTVTSGASNVIETKAGSMDSVQAFHVVKRVGGDLQNTVVPDPESSLWDKAKTVGKAMISGGLNRASEFLFGSSDVGKAVYSLIS